MEKNFKIVTLLSILLFCILMLPIVYLTFVNRATGDDYSNGVYTRAAWMGTHSLIEVGKAMCRTVKEAYYSLQGTWFSIALFSLQPEVFHDDAYVIVTVLMLFFWIGSTFYLFRQILCNNMGMNKWSYVLITVWFMVISIEFIPDARYFLFGYVGCAHYSIPFAMCQIVAAWLIRYSVEYRKSTLIGIILFMTLLGGSNYQAALFVLIVAFYTGISAWILKKDKRIFTLCIPIVLELAGLVVSAVAPGNKIRGGDEFGFSASTALQTIVKSFVCGLEDIGKYTQERPLIFVGLLFLFIVFTTVFCVWEDVFEFKHPILLSLMLFCLYSAMQAPAIYASASAGDPGEILGGISSGVRDTNYEVFLLMASGILLIIAEKLSVKMKSAWKERSDTKVLRMIVLPGILLCAVLTLEGRSNIKSSTSYISLTYITSGQARDFKEQMELQTRIMEDANTEDVVIPGTNDKQGPLMHMPVTRDKDGWTNIVTANFYGKRSVVAIERPEWMEMYGEQYE